MQSPSIQLKVPGRIHLSLLDMSGKGYRRHGGLGFSIDQGFICEAALGKELELTDRRNPTPANIIQLNKLRKIIEKVLCVHPAIRPIHFVILSGFDAHQGFGSGTSLTLALLESLFILNGQTISESQLVKLSTRGGVSGVGINGYFRGGASLDLGVKNTQEPTFYSSDQYQSVERAPLSFFRCDFPNWTSGSAFPRQIPSRQTSARMSFFTRTKSMT